jgi:adenine-specific DNA-methyltransferase
MSKLDEAIDILRQIGVPRQQQNERSGLTLLALLDVKKRTSWKSAKQQALRIHDILLFIKKQYGRDYAENTRETIRRQTIHQFEQAGIVVRNPDNPGRPTNSPKTVYSISGEAIHVIRSYKTGKWKKLLKAFVDEKGKLAEKYKKQRKQHEISVQVANTTLNFSPGTHNKLQAQIIDTLHPRFFPKATLVYVGDTAHKMLYIKQELLESLNIPLSQHDKLPDVMFYEEKKRMLFLIEAVTFHGPVSPKRQLELERTLKDCIVRKIYISAFPDISEFKRHINDIAWETEVWIADNPGHMIHFNGPKFLYVQP